MLEGFGRLERFNCGTCTNQKAYGCGSSPVQGNAVFDVAALLDESEARGWKESEVRVEAAARYQFADMFATHERVGRFWPWCPAWFARKCSDGEKIAASAVLRKKRSLDIGISCGSLTRAGSDLVLLCNQFSGWLQDDRDKAEAAKRKENSPKVNRGKRS